MQISNFIQNIQKPWMIHPDLANIMMPVLNGVLKGNSIEFDEYPKSYDLACSEIPALQEAYSDKSINVIYLQGTMLKYDSCGWPGTRSLGNQLKEADAREDIIGHIIIADSGGGNSNSVPELADAIQALKKPIVSWVDGMAASACIYAISYTDKIIAHQPMDQIGCIGTMVELSGFGRYSKDSDGYVRARIYASKSADKNNGYEAALEGNAEVIREEVLNPLNEEFIKAIKTNRPDAPDEQLTGKTYYARDVVGTLIDSIGTFDDAIQAVIDLAGSSQVQEPEPEPGTQNSSQDTNFSTTMANYPNLENIPALREQVYDPEDGTTVLQPDQLQAIEAALTPDEGAVAAQEQIDQLNQQISERDATIEANNTRIQELEAALEAANAIIDGTSPDQAPKGDPEAHADSDDQPAQTWAEAVAACNDFLSGETNE